MPLGGGGLLTSALSDFPQTVGSFKAPQHQLVDPWASLNDGAWQTAPKARGSFLAKADAAPRTSFQGAPAQAHGQGPPQQGGGPPQQGGGPPQQGGYQGHPPPNGGYPQGDQPPGAEGGPPGGTMAQSSGKTLTFTTQLGKKVEISGESYDACLQSCRDSPELKDQNQAGAWGVADAALGGERANQARCAEFCETEFELLCFPGESKVLVSGRGAVPVSTLAVGDEALSAIPDGSGGWALRFDRVVSFLHRAPSTEAEVLQISHELGKVELTPSHLLFVHKDDGPALPTLGREVAEGNRLVAAWVDGTVATPKVTRIETVRRRGLYAPLLSGGTLLVDGTVASCYALPTLIAGSAGFQQLVSALGWRNIQPLAQLCFTPVRLMHYLSSALPEPKAVPNSSEDKALNKKVMDSPASAYNPYAWVLYVLGANLL